MTADAINKSPTSIPLMSSHRPRGKENRIPVRLSSPCADTSARPSPSLSFAPFACARSPACNPTAVKRECLEASQSMLCVSVQLALHLNLKPPVMLFGQSLQEIRWTHAHDMRRIFGKASKEITMTWNGTLPVTVIRSRDEDTEYLSRLHALNRLRTDSSSRFPALAPRFRASPRPHRCR
jgi:hypothetical protein